MLSVFDCVCIIEKSRQIQFFENPRARYLARALWLAFCSCTGKVLQHWFANWIGWYKTGGSISWTLRFSAHFAPTVLTKYQPIQLANQCWSTLAVRRSCTGKTQPKRARYIALGFSKNSICQFFSMMHRQPKTLNTVLTIKFFLTILIFGIFDLFKNGCCLRYSRFTTAGQVKMKLAVRFFRKSQLQATKSKEKKLEAIREQKNQKP